MSSFLAARICQCRYLVSRQTPDRVRRFPATTSAYTSRTAPTRSSAVSCASFSPLPPSSRSSYFFVHNLALELEALIRRCMSDVPKLSITLLGAGQEVGRSCCVLQYRGRTIVCDAGVHPAYSGIASLPFVDDLDWSTVDVLLVTQYVLPCASFLLLTFPW